MFRAVFVRHGIKAPAGAQLDYDVPLVASEAQVADSVRNELACRGATPAIWLCSHFAHAWQTADALAEGGTRVVRICGLTPYSADEGAHLGPILQELGRFQLKIDGMNCIGLVGHEDRLSNLANEFLPPQSRIPRLESYLESVCLEANTFLDLDCRKGVVAFRLPRPNSGITPSGS